MCVFEAAQRVLLALRDVLEKAADVARAKVARMTLAVKNDVASGPIGVAFARLRPPESAQRSRTKLIEQSRRLRPR
jgi:hypothetical protein